MLTYCSINNNIYTENTQVIQNNIITYRSTFGFLNGEVHNLIDVTSKVYFYQKDNLSGTFKIQYKKVRHIE